MKASEGDGAGAHTPRAPGPAHWLLIGNSRWHFARPEAGGLHCWSEPPPSPDSNGGASRSIQQLPQLQAWAAVGPLPRSAGLDRRRRIELSRVPLQRMPPWLGIDRALGGWQAWRSSRTPVLVADAGTALSFTLVDGLGRFVGGRIQAGLALQLRALAGGTAQLPALGPEVLAQAQHPDAPWPTVTAEAMVVGVREGLVAAVGEAWQQARDCHPGCRLWITGGDGPWIAARLGGAFQPCLALQALACLSGESDLSSGPDR